MELFLNDYGLMWVGDTESDEEGTDEAQDIAIQADLDGCVLRVYEAKRGLLPCVLNSVPLLGSRDASVTKAQVSGEGQEKPTSPLLKLSNNFENDLDSKTEVGKYQVDMAVLRVRVQELNIVAGEGVANVVAAKDGRGAKLSMPDALVVTMYDNGFSIGTAL